MKRLFVIGLIAAFSLNVAAQCPLTSPKSRLTRSVDRVAFSKDAYEGVKLLPTLNERKNYVAGLSPNEKLAIWQAHFNYVLGNERLDMAQVSTIVNIKNSLTATDIETRTLNPELAGHVATAHKVFDRQQGKRIFEVIGENAEAESLKPICNCSQSSWCWCGTNTWVCQNTIDGCGFLWLGRCDSMCLDSV